jgi:hypothetical protein
MSRQFALLISGAISSEKRRACPASWPSQADYRSLLYHRSSVRLADQRLRPAECSPAARFSLDQNNL